MNYLVASDDQIQAHLLDKLVYHVRSKAKGHTPVVLIPTRLVLRVGPHEITKQTFLRHLTGTLQLTNTVEVPQLLREPAADAKDLLSDQGAHREAVEDLYESFPKSNVCTPFALIIEAIDPGHRCVFVVASEKLKAVRILHLAQKQKRYGVKAPSRTRACSLALQTQGFMNRSGICNCTKTSLPSIPVPESRDRFQDSSSPCRHSHPGTNTGCQAAHRIVERGSGADRSSHAYCPQ